MAEKAAPPLVPKISCTVIIKHRMTCSALAISHCIARHNATQLSYVSRIIEAVSVDPLSHRLKNIFKNTHTLAHKKSAKQTPEAHLLPASVKVPLNTVNEQQVHSYDVASTFSTNLLVCCSMKPYIQEKKKRPTLGKA